MSGKVRKIPIVEIFGPTVQGEGVDQGVAAHFIRTGGCDYHCDWCDSPHAVLAHEVRKAERLTSKEIVTRVRDLPVKAPWVVLSGGNPALHDLGSVVDELQMLGYKVAVETQGSRWKDWYHFVNRLCVSPKPPSAGMGDTLPKLKEFMAKAQSRPYRDPQRTFLKIVIFDDDDLDYAREVHRLYPHVYLYLSQGNDAGRTVGNPERVDTRSDDDVRLDLLRDSAQLVERTLACPDLLDPKVKVQSQYHVLLWGNKIGV